MQLNEKTMNLSELTPTTEFIWLNGTLNQKLLFPDNSNNMLWMPVLVGGQPVHSKKQKTFIEKNGKAPEDCLPVNKPGDPYSRHVIEFDGGTSCNSPKNFGKGYGSYQIDGGQIVRVEFGVGHSNNSAEIRTLVAALQALADIPCEKPRIVTARGDSKIALSWVKNKGVPKPSTSTGFQEAIVLLRAQVARFHSVKTEWRRRNHSVALFGH